jgi:CRISPR system Cascade subunit CasA
MGAGPAVECSLSEVLTNAFAYREIYDNSPLVTVSLHRLLLAILHRVCGPRNLREARALVGDGLPVEAIRSYLGKWHDRFDLFDERNPFYQTAGLEMSRPSGLSRLATEVNFGGIFDHTADHGSPPYSPAEAARLLVAAQSFALGFGKSGNATINGTKIEPPYSVDAILLRGVTVWLAGKDLGETLAVNLCPSESARGGDLPAWELSAPHELRDTLVDGRRRAHSARGISDRYSWQSRLLRLIPTVVARQTVVREVYFTQGRNADKAPDDPMKAYTKREEEGFTPVTLSVSRASWRDSHAMLATNRAVFRRPGMFDLVASLLESGVIAPEASFTVNVVGLATAPNKAGKFILWRHDRLPAPAVLLNDANLVERLGDLLTSAERIGALLRNFARDLCRAYLSTAGKPADSDAVNKLADEIDPRRSYWARLEGCFYALLRELPKDKETASEQWHKAVAQEARKAFHESANQLGQSARAIRARALVRPRFDPRRPSAGNVPPERGGE